MFRVLVRFDFDTDGGAATKEFADALAGLGICRPSTGPDYVGDLPSAQVDQLLHAVATHAPQDMRTDGPVMLNHFLLLLTRISVARPLGTNGQGAPEKETPHAQSRPASGTAFGGDQSNRKSRP